MSLADSRRGSNEGFREIWRAECPNGDDCVQSITFGDPALKTDVGPHPLEQSHLNECYMCIVRDSRNRTQSALFRIRDDAVEACHANPY